ncbi:hypothetical protein LT85_3640 [Collimonas arenae]|uniref:Uncharacterized protein n=1 Tax=Collimonas arenae TaxID=279058 RepID=A0A0A1FDJ7_9BURK|nr:hypothetical protein LT85_3640 [Collimonas arenae]
MANAVQLRLNGIFIYGKLPAFMKHLRERLVTLLNEEWPGHQFDRAVKGRPKKYAVRVTKKNP